MALKYDIEQLLLSIENNVDGINATANSIQREAYRMLRDELLSFDTVEGKFVAKQDLRKRLIAIEYKLSKIAGNKVWQDSVDNYLQSFNQIEDANYAMHLKYNDIKVAKGLMTPTRQLVYEQARDGLTKAVAPQYIEPVKFLLMQQVTGGATIAHGLLMLERWNDGEMTKGRYGTEPTPNLQKYATQIARDTAYSYDRNVNSIIKDTYSLNGFIYAGGIISDTRPICNHLVSLNRPINYNEIAPLLVQYPDGLIAGTNTDNFTQFCGGYNCRHRCFPTRIEAES